MSLERVTALLTKENAKNVARRAYSVVADAVALNTFSLVYSLTDHFVAHNEWAEVPDTRLRAAIGNTTTATLYRLYSTWVRDRFGLTEKSKGLKSYLVDVLAFATGQSGLYPLYLGPDATWEEMWHGAAFLTIVAPLLGTPQRLTYNFVRKKMGVKEAPATEAKTKRRQWLGATLLAAAGVGYLWNSYQEEKSKWTQGELLEDYAQDTPMGPLYRVVIETDKGVVTYPILETPEKVREMERRYHSRKDGGIGDKVEFSTDSLVFSLDEQVLLSKNFRKAEK
ncbi:MAG: hypothetical protein Q7S65_00385 [Nanoarchaeota archaeon]|nr:hypothetical protein [Nanoarchaeota archaeon]